MPSSALIADAEMPVAAACRLKSESQASKPAGSRQVAASTEANERRQKIKPVKCIGARMKTPPAEKKYTDRRSGVFYQIPESMTWRGYKIGVGLIQHSERRRFAMPVP